MERGELVRETMQQTAWLRVLWTPWKQAAGFTPVEEGRACQEAASGTHRDLVLSATHGPWHGDAGKVVSCPHL